MIVTVKIKDETYEEYAKRAPQGSAPQKVLEAVLERYVSADPRERILILGKGPRGRIEKVYGKTVSTPEEQEKLAEWIEGLASVRVNGVDFPLDEGQRKRITSRAAYYHRTFEEQLREELRELVRASI